MNRAGAVRRHPEPQVGEVRGSLRVDAIVRPDGPGGRRDVRLAVTCSVCGASAVVFEFNWRRSLEYSTRCDRDRHARRGSQDGDRRCNQCRRWRPLAEFDVGLTHPAKNCAGCRKKYSNWSGKTVEEKLGDRERHDETPFGRVVWQKVSGNEKLGPIPTSFSERGTCPPSCGLYLAGCYADNHLLGYHWSRVAERGLSWPIFCQQVRALPEKSMWRHNTAGDLPGVGDRIDTQMMAALIDANRGRRGFTFTHKPVVGRYAQENRAAIAIANDAGFTVNLSADTLQEADELLALDIGPVAVLLPHDAPLRVQTPGGARVVVCPAQTTDGMTCAECQLCINADRKSVVGFRAHGLWKYHVPELVQIRKKDRKPWFAPDVAAGGQS